MTAADLISRTTKRIGDDPTLADNLRYYQSSEVLTALNQCQRMFVFLTLCLETTATFQLTGTAFYHMLHTFSDWIAPLRVRISGGGAKIRPERLANLAALDASWSQQSGTLIKYAALGFDLLAVYKQSSDLLQITYARGPLDINASQAPEIPLRFQPALIDGAIPILRLKEGQQEWNKTLPYWSRFMDAITECGDHVRARSIEQGYDKLPIELKRFDQSRILKKAG